LDNSFNHPTVASDPSDEAIAAMFNRLGNKRVLVKYDPLYGHLSRDINEYRNKRWNQQRANLMHNYFNTPWSSIAVCSAAFVLLSTILQICFSVAKYYQKP